MSHNVSEFTIGRLYQWGVKRIYGYPGDGVNGLMGALHGAQDKIHFVQTRHEEMAAFMACAHAKFTGEVGVCLATSGPGAIHLLNGLYDARMDSQPVVAIVGQQARAVIGGSYQQEVDLLSLFKDVAGEYVHMATEPSQVRHLIDRAFRIAKAQRTVTCIIIPNDLQELAYEEPKHAHATMHSSIGYSEPRVIPYQDDLEQAADILNAGKKIAILIGAGARSAASEIKQVANILGAGVAKALLGKDVLPDDLPYVTGSIGLLGTGPSWDLMMDCDTLLLVGTGFPYSEFLPAEGRAKAIQIDINAAMLGIRYPMDVHLHGDSRLTLQALIPLLERKQDRKWRDTIEKNITKWWNILEARAEKSADPINPQYVFRELSSRLPDDCIISSDTGSTTIWFARDVKMREGMRCSVSGSLATMGPGLPYSIAAKFAYPDRVAIGLVGDGAMQMIGINGLITVAKYWREWSDPRMIILVLNNRDLNMVSWEQRAMVGDAKFDGSQGLPDFQYEEYARMLGLEGIRIDRPEDVERGLDQAMAATRPVVINVYTDPSVPILPPHISVGEMASFTSALLHGDTDSFAMIKQTIKELASNYFHK